MLKKMKMIYQFELKNDIEKEAFNNAIVPGKQKDGLESVFDFAYSKNT